MAPSLEIQPVLYLCFHTITHGFSAKVAAYFSCFQNKQKKYYLQSMFIYNSHKLPASIISCSPERLKCFFSPVQVIPKHTVNYSDGMHDTFNGMTKTNEGFILVSDSLTAILNIHEHRFLFIKLQFYVLYFAAAKYEQLTKMFSLVTTTL